MWVQSQKTGVGSEAVPHIASYSLWVLIKSSALIDFFIYLFPILPGELTDNIFSFAASTWGKLQNIFKKNIVNLQNRYASKKT